MPEAVINNAGNRPATITQPNSGVTIAIPSTTKNLQQSRFWVTISSSNNPSNKPVVKVEVPSNLSVLSVNSNMADSPVKAFPPY
ncbi:MAG: hypothetical protein SGJ00_12140 [bacterium]|nr:hypothetical protein [bacterium]